MQAPGAGSGSVFSRRIIEEAAASRQQAGQRTQGAPAAPRSGSSYLGVVRDRWNPWWDAYVASAEDASKSIYLGA